MNELVVIKCPHCGREYLPTEIYIPSAFFGDPDVIKRDSQGNIVGYVGKGLDPIESYTCDGCNKIFKVTAKISFETEIDQENDFSSEFYARPAVQYTLDEF